MIYCTLTNIYFMNYNFHYKILILLLKYFKKHISKIENHQDVCSQQYVRLFTWIDCPNTTSKYHMKQWIIHVRVNAWNLGHSWCWDRRIASEKLALVLLVTFLLIWSKKRLREGRICPAHCFRLCHYGRRSWQGQLEVPGVLHPLRKKTDECWCSALSLPLTQPKIQAQGLAPSF